MMKIFDCYFNYHHEEFLHWLSIIMLALQGEKPYDKGVPLNEANAERSFFSAKYCIHLLINIFNFELFFICASF